MVTSLQKVFPGFLACRYSFIHLFIHLFNRLMCQKLSSLGTQTHIRYGPPSRNSVSISSDNSGMHVLGWRRPRGLQEHKGNTYTVYGMESGSRKTSGGGVATLSSESSR